MGSFLKGICNKFPTKVVQMFGFCFLLKQIFLSKNCCGNIFSNVRDKWASFYSIWSHGAYLLTVGSQRPFIYIFLFRCLLFIRYKCFCTYLYFSLIWLELCNPTTCYCFVSFFPIFGHLAITVRYATND